MITSPIWQRLRPFESAGYTQKFLRRIYETKGIEEPLANSYKNGYPFCYFVDFAKKYYDQAREAPYEIKPVLLFYGASHLLKACLLTVDVHYPQTTDVLAHGISTRKKKSRHYAFLQDSVQIQKHGLFPHAVKQLFHLPPMEGTKVTMETLFKKIPELNGIFFNIHGLENSLPLKMESDGLFKIQADILDYLHMTKSRFFQFLNAVIEPAEDLSEGTLHFRLKQNDLPHYFQRDLNGGLYLPNSKNGFFDCPELLVHFLALYNLSMISRYETEWWGDLHFQKASDDLPIIQAFLDVSYEKFPFMIAEWLFEKAQDI